MKRGKKLVGILASTSMFVGGCTVSCTVNNVRQEVNVSSLDKQVNNLFDGKYDSSLALLDQSKQDYQRIKDSVYCIRYTAVYEEMIFDKDGNVKSVFHTMGKHGTGFVYKSEVIDNSKPTNSEPVTEYFIVTNHHVATAPFILNEGAYRKVSEKIEIVDSATDQKPEDNISLELVVTDEKLDMAVLKTTRKLNVYPYKRGKSSELLSGNIARAEGYPQALIKATTQGIISTATNPNKEVTFEDEDFVIDAAINPGNSGSPVFALREGDWEWVGNAHAKLAIGASLFGDVTLAEGTAFVVGIDEFAWLLEYNQTDSYKKKQEKKEAQQKRD